MKLVKLSSLATLAAATAFSSIAGGATLTHVPFANPKVAGMSAPSVLTPELVQVSVAQGAIPIGNPTATMGFYGYKTDGPMLAAPGAVQTPGHNIAASS